MLWKILFIGYLLYHHTGTPRSCSSRVSLIMEVDVGEFGVDDSVGVDMGRSSQGAGLAGGVGTFPVAAAREDAALRWMLSGVTWHDAQRSSGASNRCEREWVKWVRT